MPSDKKHIVILGSAYPLRGGGIATFNERLAREFMHSGHKVSIYSFSLQYPGFLFPGSSQFSSEPAPVNLDIHTRVNSVNPLNWISVGNELRKLKPDLLVVRYWLPFMGPSLGTILRLVKLNKYTRVVCIADNIFPHEKRPFDKTFTKYFVKPVDAFITMSEKVLADLRTISPTHPAKYIAHPLYDNFGSKVSRKEARIHLGIDTDGPILLFFGFIRKYKGLDILLDAMKILADKASTSAIKLLVAGEFYDDAQLYLNKLAQLGINDKLILRTEFIPDRDVRYYLCAADVVVQPYRNATQSGVTPLAYHFEIPMIVTNVGGLQALVPHEKVGLVADPTAESLAASITRYFEMGTAHFLPGLIEEKKKYSWTTLAEAILSI